MSRRKPSSRAGLSLHALSAALSLALAGASIATGASATPVPASNRQVQHRGQSAPPDFPLMAQRIAAAFALGARSTTSNVAPRAPATRAIRSIADQGSGSLREALATAVDGDVIDLTGLKGRIKLSAALQPAAAVTVRGPGEDLLVLDADHRGRVITSHHSLTLSGVSLVNGSGEPVVDGGPALGGCLYATGNLNLAHATISGCSLGGTTTPTAYGGAIAVAGNAYLKYCTLADNAVTAYGSATGGGLVALGEIGVLTSTISGNTANQVLPPPTARRAAAPAGGGAPPFSALGGGVVSLGSAPTIFANANLTGNSAAAAGGGTYTCYYNSKPYTCTHYGQALGGVVMSAAPVVIASTISGNSVHANGHAYGGGIYMMSTSPSLAASSAPASVVLGAIVNGGPSGPYLKYDTISGNTATSSDSWAGGGGVLARNTLTIAASAIEGNQVQSDACCYYSGGGGILATGGGLTIQASTISGNSVTSGGASASSWGGGLGAFFYEAVTIVDSTVSGNQVIAPNVANGAGIGGAALQIANSTIAFNTSSGGGGGIVLYGNSSPVFSSTIIADNAATTAASADVLALNNAVVAGSNNLVIANSGATLPGDTLSQDPQLLPLAFNGGPTRTHALAAGSPAIDAGINPLALSTDQRGYTRVVGANADIGAFEVDNDRIFTNGFDARLGGS